MSYSKEDVHKFLEESKFTFAKTMANIPHAWCAKSGVKNKDLYESAVSHIRDHGVVEYFYNKPYTYYYHEGYKYWSMGAPIDKTTIINRAKVDGK